MADSGEDDVVLDDRNKKRKMLHDENQNNETSEKRVKMNNSREESHGTWTDVMDQNLLKLVENNCDVLRQHGAKFVFAKNVKWQSIAERLFNENGMKVEAAEVRNRWEEMTKRIRKVRTVPEMLEDIKQNLSLHLDTIPKKPMTSYQYFCNSKRARISEKYPGLSFADMQKKFGRKWREMPAEKKSKYERKALKEKQRYEEELKRWQQVHPEAYAALENEKRKDSTTSNLQKNVSPFDIFAERKSQELKTKHPNITSADLKEKLNRRWEKLKEHKRERYIEEAKVMNDNHKKNSDVTPKSNINKKTKRDPSMPKKPPNSYNLYCQDQREILLKENPELDFGTLSKINSQGWKELTIEQSKIYHDRAKALKVTYLQKLADFENEKGTNL